MVKSITEKTFCKLLPKYTFTMWIGVYSHQVAYYTLDAKTMSRYIVVYDTTLGPA